MNITGYDEWKLEGPDEGRQEPGTEEGETCGRYEEPDEDAPRGYKPKPCGGVMRDAGWAAYCDTCGEIGD